MADVIITVRLMPSNTGADLKNIEEEARKVIEKEGGTVYKVETEPIAFGLLSLKIVLLLNEDKGTESLEKELAKINDVSSASIIEITRAVG